MPFPNKATGEATRLKGGERRGKEQPPIGRRTARKMHRDGRLQELFHGSRTDFYGTNEEWLIEVRDNRIIPTSMQLYAAATLQRWGSGAGDSAKANKVDLSALTDDERRLFASMLARVMGEPPLIEALPAPIPQSEPAPVETQRAEWVTLLAEAETRGVPEHEIVRFRERFREAFPDE